MKDSSSLTASMVTDELDFDALAPEWDQLLEESDQFVFFLRFSWNRLWWRLLRPPDSELFIVTFRDTKDKLVGLAPLYLRQRRTAGIPHLRELMFLGTGIYAQTSEYIDVIARRGYERSVAEATVKFLRLNRGWDRLCLREIPASSIILHHLRAALGDDGQIEACNRSYFIDTTVEWEELTSNLSHSARQNVLRRTRKLLSMYECRLKRVETPDELGPATEAFERLHQARWHSKGEPGTFALSGIKEFLTESMRLSLGEGRLGLMTLELDGKIAAVRLDFRDNHISHAFQAGFDPAYANLSLGHVMNGLCIRACVEDDWVRKLDLMSGSGSYKESWTKNYQDSVCLTLLRTGTRSAAFKSIEMAKVVGKSLIRATVPQPLRLAGHRLITQRHYK